MCSVIGIATCINIRSPERTCRGRAQPCEANRHKAQAWGRNPPFAAVAFSPNHLYLVDLERTAKALIRTGSKPVALVCSRPAAVRSRDHPHTTVVPAEGHIPAAGTEGKKRTNADSGITWRICVCVCACILSVCVLLCVCVWAGGRAGGQVGGWVCVFLCLPCVCLRVWVHSCMCVMCCDCMK